MKKRMGIFATVLAGLLAGSYSQAAQIPNQRTIIQQKSSTNLSAKSLKIINKIMPTIEKMAYLFNDDKALAQEAIQKFKGDWIADIKDMGEDEFQQIAADDGIGDSLHTYFKGSTVLDLFSIDAKDTDSALGYLQDHMDKAGIQKKLQFNVKNPATQLRADQIFYQANQQLNTMGYSLLGLETGSDSYIEMLLPAQKAAEFKALAQQIGMPIDNHDKVYQ